MEKKKAIAIARPSENFQPESNGNQICCCEPKKCTLVIGLIEIVLHILIGVTGTIAAFVSVSEYDSQDKARAHAEATFACKVLWSGVFLGVMVDVVLLIGNAIAKKSFLWPWLIITWISLIVSIVAVASSATAMPLFATLLSLVVYAIFLAFPLYVVHQRLDELSGLQDRRHLNAAFQL